MPSPHSPRGSLLFFGCVAAALFTFPLVAGWSVVQALGSGAFAVAFVFLPGYACLAWTDDQHDRITSAFLAFVVGLAPLTLCFVTLAAFDARQYLWILPVLGCIAILAAPRRTSTRDRPTTTSFEACIALLPIAAALMRVEIESPADWFRGFESDNSFHVENAIELSRHWPMTDPRIAGEPLRYHFMSYVPASAASLVLGLPVRVCMLGLGAHLLPMMFALGLFVAARATKAGVITSACAALALVLHVDLGTHVGRVLGVDGAIGSYFDVGIYRSITTVQGLCVFVAIAIVLRDALTNQGQLGRRLFLLAFLSALASGSKGSVLPPLFVALAATWLWRRADRRVIGWALLVMALAALPFTAWLTLDSDGYAQSMFHFEPAAAQILSGFQSSIVAGFGGDPAEPAPWATALLFVPWVVGFFGIGTVAAWAWFRTRPRPSSTFEFLLCATALSGFVPVLFLMSHGFAQLLFAYDSQVCVILLGAIASTRVSGGARIGYAIAAGAVLATQLVAVAWTKAHDARIGPRFTGDVARYRSALEWIRTETPSDAVLLIDDPRLSATTWCERRAFFETRRFTPAMHAALQVEKGRVIPIEARPFAEREILQSEFFSNPTADGVRSIRAIVGPHKPIIALRTRLVVTPQAQHYACVFEPLEDAAEFGRACGLEFVHAGGIVAVYRLPD
ncbi:MAG: hypothetical protein JNL28_14065 [Planctomycetes bacterium]|nr:hypothetical protein [Planctomycetota bacterium]